MMFFPLPLMRAFADSGNMCYIKHTLKQEFILLQFYFFERICKLPIRLSENTLRIVSH